MNLFQTQVVIIKSYVATPCTIPITSFCWRALMSSYKEHLFKCFSDGECTFQEVNLQTEGGKKTVTQGYFHRNPYCTSQHRTREPSRMNKTTWAASCTYLHQVSPLLRTALAAISQGTGLWFVPYKRDLKDKLNISVTEQRQSQILPLIFRVTGLCLNVTGHKAWTKADSLHPAHVIISIDSSPMCVFVLLLKSHWLEGTTYYPLLARE